MTCYMPCYAERIAVCMRAGDIVPDRLPPSAKRGGLASKPEYDNAPRSMPSPCLHARLQVFAVGENILAMQSHPEFDLETCIMAKIWPSAVIEKGRLDEEQKRDALESFAKPRHHRTMLAIVRRFIDEAA